MDVLTALRAATAEQHSVLDRSTPLAAPAPDLHAYRDHLQLLLVWLTPIQAWLARCGAAPRLRADYAALLREDLAHPSLAGAAPTLQADAAPWPQDASAAYRWGVCYVAEGSQLGGAVLYKRLAQSLQPHPLGYLRGEGTPGPRWQQFLAGLRAAVVSEHDIADACLGARQAFASLIALNHQL